MMISEFSIFLHFFRTFACLVDRRAKNDYSNFLMPKSQPLTECYIANKQEQEQQQQQQLLQNCNNQT
jgi:hypothetical protein